ncbi:UDP-glucose dehydrogenase family protein [Bacillus sp. NPDC077411]|uniref:UDP-glucose dehydrogenase family protein n=1 Tax=Bacillus sp. NPDC077411 TaxID=3363947 RepID=UPI0037C85620
MKITVVGTGYVGLVTGIGLATLGHSVTCFDIDEQKIRLLEENELPIYEPGLQKLLEDAVLKQKLSFTSKREEAYEAVEYIFVAVGTPSYSDGSANLTHIVNMCSDIGMYAKQDVIVVTKSTVPVGTNDAMKEWIQAALQTDISVHLVSNPEFLREGCGVHDFFHGDRIVIGAEKTEIAKRVANLYKSLSIEVFTTDIRSAEMIKYASNAFLATKISFINEISSICEKVQADVTEVAAGMGIDKRIGPHFLQAGIGYGGSCFPKDTNALVQIAGNVAHDFRLLKAVIEVNNKQQASLVEKAEKVMNLQGKRVAVLGLSFKPNTDDIREAPSLLIIEQLLARGAHVIVYDPKAILHAKRIFMNRVQYSMDISEAIIKADVAFIVTEWESIRTYPIAKYVQLMNEPIVFDGRNCYALEEVEQYAVDYYSIGRRVIRKRDVSHIF